MTPACTDETLAVSGLEVAARIDGGNAPFTGLPRIAARLRTERTGADYSPTCGHPFCAVAEHTPAVAA